MIPAILLIPAAVYAGVKLFGKYKEKLSEESFESQESSKMDKNVNDESQQDISLQVREQKIASKYQKEIDNKFSLSLATLGLNAFGLAVYPPLTIISLPVLIYLCSSFIKNAYEDIVNKKKVGISTMDAVISIAVLSLGYWFACSLYCSLFFFSQKVLLKTQNRSKQNLVNLLGEQPRFVWIMVEDVEVEIPFSQLKEGDLVVIGAGEMIPIDGTITHGIASIDQHCLTGESIFVEKSVDDNVFASSIVLSGKIHVKVEKTGQKTIAGQISDVLNQTVNYKSDIEWRGEDIADKSALPTLLVCAMSLPLIGPNRTVAIQCGYFGYNMRILSPLSLLNYLNLTTQKGILVKDGSALESLTQVDTIIFDKTGTLTHEIPNVKTIHQFGEYSEDDLLRWAAMAEYKQKHPVAQAILNEAEIRGLTLSVQENSTFEIGYGIQAWTDNHLIHVGSMRYMQMEQISVSSEIEDIENNCYEEGYSLVYVAIDKKLSGAIEIHPTVRSEAKSIIAALKKRQISTYIISGDHEKPTKRLAERLGINHYFSETLPKDKADIVVQLQKSGKKVCFIGDGINDSIALKKANVSISLNGASTIATDNAQIILMDESLSQLDYLLNLADSMDANMRRNLTASIVPGIVIIGGVFFLNFGIVTATLIYNLGLLAGLVNTSLPLKDLKNTHNKKNE
jgi:Cu2+-exporting ATPase